MRLTESERFWIKVDPIPDANGCVHWTAGKYHSGYGAFKAVGRNMVAHRYAWIERFGPILDGMLVLHHCDVRSCVNTDHLFLGSHADNTADMIVKGRAGWQNGRLTNVGLANGRAKLNQRKVNGILLLVAQGVRQVDAGRQYGVGQSTVSRIVRGVGWQRAA